MSELERIVTEPIPLHVFEVENQDALHVIRSKLVTVLCQCKYIISGQCIYYDAWYCYI